MGQTYLLATRSAGKLRELRELFDAVVAAGHLGNDVRVIDLEDAGFPETADEDGIECFETFEENARAKAEYFHRLSGLPTFADDSGLVVHALGGEPGVRSKRWSGRAELTGVALDAANNTKLVNALAALPDGTVPLAEYVCAAAFVDAERTRVTVGRTHGRMLVVPRGAHGFGYDAYFASDELQKTFGEATVGEKERVSHRGRAFGALLHDLFDGVRGTTLFVN
jgi:XTP/dITP diphosphohydrolase